jgi:hypothetical protein
VLKNPRTTIVVLIAVSAAVAVTAGFLLGRSSHEGANPRGRADGTFPASATTRPAAPRAAAPRAATTAPRRTSPRKVTKSGAKHARSWTPTADAPPAVTLASVVPALDCPAATVTVHDAAGLRAALTAARPGTVIHLSDGVYHGRFTGSVSGTPSAPIWVCGTRQAIIDDARTSRQVHPPAGQGDYGFHLVGASWWRLVGFSVRNAQKGVVLDKSSHTILHGLAVYHIGDEAIHLRDFSSDNVVEGCVVRDTGLRVPFYGEGIYVGSSVNNWGQYSGGQPDASDRNVLRHNDISLTTAENIDIKEGTSDGEIADNHLDGTGMVAAAAMAWVNVKGNNYRVHDNTGSNSVGDGFATHKIVSGSGQGNVFSANTIGSGVAGYGIAFYSKNNTLTCDNHGQGQKGLSNVNCT